MNFRELAQSLLISAEHYLNLWFPNGDKKGSEYQVGSLQGEKGRSLSINIHTGVWKDFATGESGGDLISLYAAKKNISQIDAAKELAPLVPTLNERYDLKPSPNKKNHGIIKPPPGTAFPDLNHSKHGKSSAFYKYTDVNGETLFIIARYDHKKGKDLIPFCFTKDNKWINRMWPGLRPLYGLGPELIEAKNVLVVEGEKSVNAAKKIIGDKCVYHVVTWSGGSHAHDKTDWTPLFNKRVLIWPDADTAGKKAAQQIAARLFGRADEVKIINTGNINGGWDAADALEEGMGWDKFLEWAKPRVEPIKSIEDLEDPPMPKTEQITVVDFEDENGNLRADAFLPQDTAPEINRLWVAAGVITSRTTGNPIISEDNVIRLLNYTKILHGRLWFDEFHIDFFTDFNGPPRPWTDREILELLLRFQRDYGFQRLSMGTLETAIRAYAYRYKRNAAKDYLNSLKWDGVSRIQSFFTDYLNASDNLYTRCASRNWWISMVARAISPGCQVDNMVIFEGIQGARKSTLLKEIAQDWYAEASSAFGTKDFYQQIQGKLIIEIAELDMFSKSDVNTIKRVISNTTDEFRAPYERKPGKFPRTCIFVGTTNQDGYLMDETGNRRYWPIPVKNINIDRVRDDRELLLAEAVALFKQGEDWWQMPDAETKDMQAQRMADDPWLDPISKYIDDIERKVSGVTCINVATDCLQIEIGRVSRRETLRIAKCLRQLGWESRVVREGDTTKKKFVQPDSERLNISDGSDIKEKKEIKNYAPTFP